MRAVLDITPLPSAVNYAPLLIINLLLKHGGTVAHGQLLHFAACRKLNDRVQVLDLLLLIEAPGLNEIMYQTQAQSFRTHEAFGLGTPLHYAARHGYVDVVRYLLGKGVDGEIRDSCANLLLIVPGLVSIMM